MTKETQRRKWFDRMLGGSVCAVFVGGVYAIAHFALHADDQTILIFALALIWSDMTTYINKPDTPAS